MRRCHGARKVFAAIERAIGDGSSASVSYIDFRLDHGISRKAVSPSLKLLDHLGLIEIESGKRLINRFRLSRRWCTIDEVEAVRLAALAQVKPHRTFGKPPEPKPVDDKALAPFVDYLQALYAEKAPDLIVALGAPAAEFVQRYRHRLSQGTDADYCRRGTSDPIRQADRERYCSGHGS